MQEKNHTFIFKKLEETDLPLLHKWFKEPHVAQWWPTLEYGEFLAHFFKRIRSHNTFGYIVLLNNKPIGYIQYYYIDRTDEKSGSWFPQNLPVNTIGTDQFIGEPEYIGKGYGTQFIKQFIDFVHKIEPSTTTVIVDPDPENHAAIRVYEKIGFKKVGIFEVTGGSHLLMKYNINLHE